MIPIWGKKSSFCPPHPHPLLRSPFLIFFIVVSLVFVALIRTVTGSRPPLLLFLYSRFTFLLFLFPFMLNP